jgi:hypothetical protein
MLSRGFLLQLLGKSFRPVLLSLLAVAPSTAFTIKTRGQMQRSGRGPTSAFLPPPFFQKAKSRVPMMQSIAAAAAQALCCDADHVYVLLINYVKTHTLLSYTLNGS